MSQVSLSKKPYMCLNMIVKNESHVITDLLKSIYKYIDYYVISDTGSTDGTQDIITNFFRDKNIPGEIHQNTWTCPHKEISYFDFGYNRSLALSLCQGKSQYIWIMDADDILVGELPIKNLKAECYDLIIGKDIKYTRPMIFKNDRRFKWSYKGVLHEHIHSDKKYKSQKITGDYYIDSRRLGDRSKDKQKYIKDAKILEWFIKTSEPNNSRYYFYGGQSYMDAYKMIMNGQDLESIRLKDEYLKNSMRMYKKRTQMGGFIEEVFLSWLSMGKISILLKYPWEDSEKFFVKAQNCLDSRSPESIYEVITHYNNINQYENMYKWASKVSDYNIPKNCSLFINTFIYTYGCKLLLAESCQYTGRYDQAILICRKLINNLNYLPYHIERRIKKCIERSTIEKMDRTKYKPLNEHMKIITSLFTHYQWNDLHDYCKKLIAIGMEYPIIEEMLDRSNENLSEMYIQYTPSKINAIQEKIGRRETRDETKDKKESILAIIINWKGYHELSVTINSFINACEDISLIDRYIYIHVGNIDKTFVLSNYPFLEIVFCKDHVDALNTMINMSKSYPYILYMDTRWKYIYKRPYISQSIDILDENSSYGQIVFNKYYAITPSYKSLVGSGISMLTCKNTKYILHEHIPKNTPMYHSYMNRVGIPNSAYWPHFSLSPSIIVGKVFADIGYFSKCYQYELDYAHQYNDLGYQTVFMDAFCTDKINNGVPYINKDSSSINIFVMGLKKWTSFKNFNHYILPYYQRYTRNSDVDSNIFGKPFLESHHSICSYMNTMITMLKDIKTPYGIILTDDIILPSDFMSHVLKIIQSMGDGYDIVFLDDVEKYTNPYTLKEDKNINETSLIIPHGYIIRKERITDWMTFISKNGINNFSDLYKYPLLKIGKVIIY